jgi:mitochondrial fission protein ELM1
VDPRHLDLVVTTSDYLQPRGANVLVMPLPVVSPTGTDQPRPDWIADLPQPRLLFLIGGPLKHYDLTPAAIAEAVAFLASRANKDRGSLIVSGSPRTPDELIAAAETALAAARNGRMVTARTGGLAPIIASADEIFVTGDSMAMITEAILSGAPVGIVPLALTSSGRHKLGNQPAADGSRSRRRDLRRFWTGLWKSGLAGTLDEPKRGAKQIPSKQAADAVRRLLDPAAPKPHERAE